MQSASRTRTYDLATLARGQRRRFFRAIPDAQLRPHATGKIGVWQSVSLDGACAKVGLSGRDRPFLCNLTSVIRPLGVEKVALPADFRRSASDYVRGALFWGTFRSQRGYAFTPPVVSSPPLLTATKAPAGNGWGFSFCACLAPDLR